MTMLFVLLTKVNKVIIQYILIYVYNYVGKSNFNNLFTAGQCLCNSHDLDYILHSRLFFFEVAGNPISVGQNYE